MKTFTFQTNIVIPQKSQLETELFDDLGFICLESLTKHARMSLEMESLVCKNVMGPNNRTRVRLLPADFSKLEGFEMNLAIVENAAVQFIRDLEDRFLKMMRQLSQLHRITCFT